MCLYTGDEPGQLCCVVAVNGMKRVLRHAWARRPVLGSRYVGETPPALAIQKKVLSKIRKPVTLPNITNLSILRKDGHPSIYGLGGHIEMDCSH
ncbi:hypothetical protein RJ640_011821 [Escallonia rubra]|uniref:Trichome birefringence-like C-terminal domain-containing protein n=1 Tax=Escallonia rubra TaxID=112253 RepID=A0AA88QZL6_9ASTE|nr:hypothetical protein RJ640_011821 [Escallonia rubra]